MEIETGTVGSITKKHFAKLHERIQSKYEEMQKKLEKSKSIDMLLDADEDFLLQDRKKCTSVSDLRSIHEQDNSIHKNQNGNFMETIVYFDKQKDAVSSDIVYNHIDIIDSECVSLASDIKCDEEIDTLEENVFFKNNYLNTSLESLNDVTKESDEFSDPITPPPRSIRDKINSKLKQRKESRKRFKEYFSINSNRYLAKTPKKNKIATVTVVLVELKGLEDSDEDKQRILSFRFKLGSEKRKSKLIRSSQAHTKFQELFSFNLYDEDYILEASLWDRDIFIGSCRLNLLDLKKEKTYQIRQKLEGEFKNIECFLLLTISGTTMNTVFDITECEEEESRHMMQKKYAWFRVTDQFSNVGVLTVTVYGAKGLSGQDCYCVLNLNNERIQTQTDWRTNEPNWMKIITLKVTDITSILEVVIYDEKKSEEVGRIAIPLLKIKPGKKWFALKDSTLKEKAKGNNARILLEMYITWNLIKAAVRVINPKEVNYLQTEEKLTRHAFAKNLSRAKAITMWIMDAFKILKSCFEWESKKLNLLALFIWIVFCLIAKLWMLPLLLLIPFYWYRPKITMEIDSADSKTEKEDKNVSLRQKIQSLQEMVQSIQNVIGALASTGESVKNLFNFTVPFVSYLAIFFIVTIAFVMYLIPFNYICLIWGVHKYMRKFIRPNHIPNNEILDLLSRIPDDETVMECEELPLGDISEDDELTLAN
ncbi:unnamed protein product, partial [Brenthis ino]